VIHNHRTGATSEHGGGVNHAAVRRRRRSRQLFASDTHFVCNHAACVQLGMDNALSPNRWYVCITLRTCRCISLEFMQN